jgi:hypothetical protein
MKNYKKKIKIIYKKKKKNKKNKKNKRKKIRKIKNINKNKILIKFKTKKIKIPYKIINRIGNSCNRTMMNNKVK